MIEPAYRGRFHLYYISAFESTNGHAFLVLKAEPSQYHCSVQPGYRVYYIQYERTMIILLAGGDKSTQARDIKTALRLARNL